MTGSSAGEATLAAGEERWQRLPPWLRPRTVELKGGGNLRLIETTLLVLVGVVLATATVNDVGREVGINRRLIADLKTWRQYTGHDYHNISIDQEALGAGSDREVLCGNTSPGPPKGRTQICLAIWGAVVSGRRTVHGGWYLPPGIEDVTARRYGCFGPAGRGRCPG
ncbi:MAG: hypothetical protein ACLPUT_06680 [Solirubrobacteraceae bacterium]|jgi:hypothetical protein